jgi:hypothetical protein
MPDNQHRLVFFSLITLLVHDHLNLHCSILSLFYLIFVYLFALSHQASYRLPLAIDRPIDMIHPKLFRLTTHLPLWPIVLEEAA